MSERPIFGPDLVGKTIVVTGVVIAANVVGNYALETALARCWLHETVDWRRWLGAVLVAAGVALLSF